MEVLAADIGYGFTKIVSASRVRVYPSVVIPKLHTHITVDIDTQKDSPDIVSYGNTEYLYGSKAMRFGKKSQFPPRHRCFTQSNTYAVLLLSALSLVHNRDVYFVTGLPVSVYENEGIKTSYQEWVLNILRPHGAINIKVLPQAMGAYYDAVLDIQGKPIDKNLLMKKCAVVDIGYYTTDIVVLDHLDLIYRETIPLGVSIACEFLVQELSSQKEISMHEAEMLLRGEKLFICGKPVDVSNTIEAAKDRAWNLISTAVTDRIGRGEDFHLVIPVGGGSVLYRNKLARLFKGAHFSHNPSLSNAYGYFKYGIRQIRKELKNA